MTPRSSSALGLEVVRMIEAVDPSIELGGAKVAVGQLDPLTMASPRASERDVDLSRT